MITSLNLKINTWVDIRGEFILPLCINIADIDVYNEHIFYNKFHKEGQNIEIDIAENPFKEYLIYEEFKKDIEYFFKFINTSSILYKEGTLYDHLQTKDLFNYFCNIGFTDNDFIYLKKNIMGYIIQLKELFVVKAKEILKINDNPKRRRSKYNINYNAYDTEQTEDFMNLQTMIEYHNSTPIFHENIGKSYDQYSWREIHLRMLFLHRKQQIDSELKAIENDLINKKE